MYVHLQFGKDEVETRQRIQQITDEVKEAGFSRVVPLEGESCISVNCIGEVPLEKKEALIAFLEATYPWVIDAMVATSKFKLLDRNGFPDQFRVKINSSEVGGRSLFIIAGPCAVESRNQILETAQAVKAAGAHALRGGAFKPRTDPWSFQGLGEEGLKYLSEARELTGLPVVTEAVRESEVDMVAAYTDVIQIGARNAQNFGLLEKVAKAGKAMLYKRGEALRIEDWLRTAEYLVKDNRNVILCPRGIAGRDAPLLRNNADIDAVVALRALTCHPVIFDPSHACGRKEFVVPLALAAIAAGADGIIIEVHPDPSVAKSDREQQLNFAEFADFMVRAKAVAVAVGREI